MGDSGSLFLGFLLAAIGIKLRFPDNVPQVTWIVPILVLFVPILDTTLVVVSRLRRGSNPFLEPGQDHLSHRLVALGCSPRQAVLGLYAVAGAFGLLGVLASRTDPTGAWILAVLTLTFGCVSILMLEARAKH